MGGGTHGPDGPVEYGMGFDFSCDDLGGFGFDLSFGSEKGGEGSDVGIILLFSIQISRKAFGGSNR